MNFKFWYSKAANTIFVIKLNLKVEIFEFTREEWENQGGE